jgi:large subunit ribosomal protein L3
MPGSIGSTGPQRVSKGKKMAGRMGAQRVTIKNLKIVKINSEKSEIYVKGAVPGARNSLLMIIRE